MSKLTIRACRAIIALREYVNNHEQLVVDVLTTLLIIAFVDFVLLLIGTLL